MIWTLIGSTIDLQMTYQKIEKITQFTYCPRYQLRHEKMKTKLEELSFFLSYTL